MTEEDRKNYEREVNVKGILRRIYNPIEIGNGEDICYNMKSKIIISAGTLNYNKGFDMLIDVAKIVLKKHNDWRWVVCGEGEERKRLEEKIEKK